MARESFPELRTDMYGAVVQSIHYAGGSALQLLENAANAYFSGDQIDYGGAVQGIAVTGSGVTIKPAPGVVVNKNADGTTTVTKVTGSGSKTVFTYDDDGKLVDTKQISIQFTADGGAFQRITDDDGTVRDVTLTHGGDGLAPPDVYFDAETGQTTLVQVLSTEDHSKVVTTVSASGELLDRREYDYTVVEGAIVESYVDAAGQTHSRVLLDGGLPGSGTLRMGKDGSLQAGVTIQAETGEYIQAHLVISSSSNKIQGAETLYYVTSDGAVTQSITWVDQETGQLTNYSTTLIPAVEGGGTPTMEVSPNGMISFVQTRDDGSKIFVLVNELGESQVSTITFEARPDGSCEIYIVQEGELFQNTILHASGSAGTPLIVSDQKTGNVEIVSYQDDGSIIKVHVSNLGDVLSRTRTTFEYKDGQYTETIVSLAGNGEATMTFQTTGEWIDVTGTEPPPSDAPANYVEPYSDRWEAIHGVGGLWDNWQRQLDWDRSGVPGYLKSGNAGAQTIGDSKWSGWKENGGTIERKLVDFTGSATVNGVQKAFHVKAAESGDDLLQGSAGIDMLYAGAGNDTLLGGDGSDHLSGEDGNDVVDGGNGNDVLHGGHGDDLINGGAGHDLIDDAMQGATDGANVSGHDTMSGGDGNDMVFGRLGNDLLNGDAGHDSLFGGEGDDTMNGGVGADVLNGDEGNDRLSGDDGNDLLSGGLGNDVVNGGDGNDRLYGNEGSDTLRGGAGDDLLHGGAGAGADVLDGGEGIDTAYYGGSASGLYIDLAAGVGHAGEAAGDRLKDVENVIGSAHDDVILVGNASGTWFDTADYLARNADVKAHIEAHGLDLSWAYHHWVTWGRFEGRQGGWDGYTRAVGADGGTSFDLDGYLSANEDVRAYKIKHGLSNAWVLEHWLNAGRHEGRLGALKVSGSVIAAGAGNDVVHGGVYSDYIVGGAGNDWLAGHAGHDVLLGGEGQDTLRGGDGNDQIFGGLGDDVIDDTVATNAVYGHDSFDGGAGNDWLFGRYGNDTLMGGTGNDHLDGGEDDDSIDGGEGQDAIQGWTGHDTIYGRTGNDVIFGGAGNDRLDAGEDDDYVEGGEGHDTLIGWTGHDTLHGGDGNDHAEAGDGNDHVTGGWGDDSLYGQWGDDVVHGDGGNDYINGDVGHDRLYGGDGHDWIDAQGNNDYVSGGSGNDRLNGGANEDTLDGGADHDALYGEDGYDVLFGGLGNDFLSGGHHNDTLYGGAHEDTLHGSSGNDILFGEDGYDQLNGDAGNDILYGGAHGDMFVFHANSGEDVIKDFGAGDVIRLSGVTYSYSDFWGRHNKPETVGYWDWVTFVPTGTVITADDGRKILIEGIRAEQLKGGIVDGAWQWWL